MIFVISKRTPCHLTDGRVHFDMLKSKTIYEVWQEQRLKMDRKFWKNFEKWKWWHHGLSNHPPFIRVIDKYNVVSFLYKYLPDICCVFHFNINSLSPGPAQRAPVDALPRKLFKVVLQRILEFKIRIFTVGQSENLYIPKFHAIIISSYNLYRDS